MAENFEILEDEVEFDEELYAINCAENDFTEKETDGICSDDVEGEYE